MFNRRDCLKFGFSFAAMSAVPNLAMAVSNSASSFKRLLILIELKGGNDGLNTVIPFADARYYEARPKIAIPRDKVLQLDEKTGLNPAMQALMPLWKNKNLAIVQGLGYEKHNLSHFRSIEVWDTASSSDEYLKEGWLTRALHAAPLPKEYVADGVIIGSSDLGPLAGGARAVVLARKIPLTPGKMGMASDKEVNASLNHLLKVQQDLTVASIGLNVDTPPLKTQFPEHDFGQTVKTAIETLAKNGHIGAMRLTLPGFDTHINQLDDQTDLLRQLAEGIAALQSGLQELGRWNDTVVMTYAEFGRRVAENLSAGTDHGTANVHFVAGGAVKGGLYGKAPDLGDLDAGNLKYAVDFHSLYASMAAWCWGDKARKAVSDVAPLKLFSA